MKEKLLKIKQASKLLGVSNETLRNWDKSGKLKAVRTKGGHRRWKISDLHKLIKTNNTNESFFNNANFSILQGNAYELICELNQYVEWLGQEVHCVITSPPYFNKRSYGDNDKEIGCEHDIERYIESLVKVFNAIPLSHRGSLWVNIGDKRQKGQLNTIPEHFALKMMQNGWKLIDHVIWAKVTDENDGTTQGGCMTEPAKSRLNGNGWESIYRFVKCRPQEAWTDTYAVALPRENVVDIRYLPEELMKSHSSIEGRSLHNVWRVPMGQTKYQHYAVYPSVLCERPVAMTCPMWIKSNGEPSERTVEMVEYDEGRNRGKRIFGKYKSLNSNSLSNAKISGRFDSGRSYVPRKPKTTGWTHDQTESLKPGIVLDPFCGTSTTGEVALKMGRSYIGIDLYDKFTKISQERCENILNWMKNKNLDPWQLVN